MIGAEPFGVSGDIDLPPMTGGADRAAPGFTIWVDPATEGSSRATARLRRPDEMCIPLVASCAVRTGG